MSGKVSCSELVGRSAEQTRLEEALRSARRGRATTVIVSGEPGIGKTRLVSQLCSDAAADGCLVAVGSCSPVAGPDLPYAPVVSLLRSLARSGPDHAEAVEPALLALGSGAAPEIQAAPRSRPEAGPLAQTWLFNAILESVAAVAARAHAVLVVEDLQWADHGTLGVVDYLTRNLDRSPVLLVCTSRSDELAQDGPLRTLVSEMARWSSVDRLELQGLTADAIEAMSRDIRGRSLPAARIADIEKLTGGNPFFAEELLANDDRDVPSGLREALMARVDRLSAAARQVLEAMSVFGGTVEHRLLVEVVDFEGVELDQALREPVNRQIVVVDGNGYRFRHDLLRETLYESLLPGERRRLHGRVAKRLDADPDPDGRLVAELARHWSNAGEWAFAFATGLTAADAALSLYAFDDAIAQFERALEAWDHLAAAGAEPTADRIDILGRAADAAFWGGIGERAVVFARGAVDLADPLKDPLAAARCWTRLGRCLWAVGDPSASFDALAEAERLLPEGPSVELARVQAERAKNMMLMSRFDDAAGGCQEAINTARVVGARLEEGNAICTLGVCLSMLGKIDEGLELLRLALEVAEELEDAEALNRAYGNLSSILADSGHLEEAAVLTLDMVARGEALGGIRLSGSAFNSAEALLRLGRWQEAEVMARDFGGRPSGPCAVTPAFLHISLSMLRGDVDGIREMVADVGERTTSMGDMQFRGTFHLLDAQIALLDSRYSDASDAVDQGLALAAGTDEQILATELCATGIRALVDGAVHARSTGRRVDDAKVRLLAAELVEKAEEIAARPRRLGLEPLPRTSGWLAQCAAEASRLGEDSARAWEAAACLWRSLGEPFPEAYCQWRQAEAILTRRGSRVAAKTLVAEAWRTAAALGAGPLREDIETLASRARIEIDTTVPAPSITATVGSDLGLTVREVEVLGQLAAGRSDAQIAEALFISKKTASVHVSNILRKLGVPGRVEAGDVGRQAGLVETLIR